MSKRTPLHSCHKAAGARLVDFAGWEMPLHYGSQVEEHHAVRRSAGMFDVSHMCQVDIAGDGSTDFLRRVFANDVGPVAVGRALYGCLLNETGGVIDDGIAYRFGDHDWRLVINAATRDKDIAWLHRQAEGLPLEIRERTDRAMIAIQGPEARERVHGVLAEDLAGAASGIGRFRLTWNGDTCVARTGYTGEDGYEIMLPAGEAEALWDALAQAGVRPVGLGARDTLRLEAGMALYGHEMDEEVTPLEAGLGWTVAWEPEDRAFIGREALERQRSAGVARRLVGLLLEGRGVARAGQRVATDAGDGEVTSGGFSPTIGQSIALARIPVGAGERVEIEIRGRPVPARVVKTPFVREGEVRITP